MFRIEYYILHTVTVIIMLAEDKIGQTPPVSSVILCSPPSSEPRTLCFCYSIPALTVMASMNWSLQEFVPTTSARLVFLISLSTVLCVIQ